MTESSKLQPLKLEPREDAKEARVEAVAQLASESSPFIERKTPSANMLPPKALTRWRRRRVWLTFTVPACLIVVFSALFIYFWCVMAMNMDTGVTAMDDVLCDSQDRSKMAQYFIIDLRFGNGNLTFTQVKIIDVAWDIVVGQGGRFLLAWLLFHVGGDCMIWMMEASAVPYHMIASVMFAPVSMSSTWSLLRVLSREGDGGQR